MGDGPTRRKFHDTGRGKMSIRRLASGLAEGEVRSTDWQADSEVRSADRQTLVARTCEGHTPLVHWSPLTLLYSPTLT